MGDQRQWHRKEAPGTHRGHSLVSDVGGTHWEATELKTGKWKLTGTGRATRTLDDFTSVRREANPAPVAFNPLTPMLASAAVASAMTGAFRALSNPRRRNPWPDFGPVKHPTPPGMPLHPTNAIRVRVRKGLSLSPETLYEFLLEMFHAGYFRRLAHGTCQQAIRQQYVKDMPLGETGRRLKDIATVRSVGDPDTLKVGDILLQRVGQTEGCGRPYIVVSVRPLETRGEGFRGGRAAGRLPRDFDARQLEIGTRMEMEHTTSRRVAQRLAMDHLVQHPDYYIELAKMEAMLRKRRLEGNPGIGIKGNPGTAKIAHEEKIGDWFLVVTDHGDYASYVTMNDATGETMTGSEPKGTSEALASVRGQIMRKRNPWVGGRPPQHIVDDMHYHARPGGPLAHWKIPNPQPSRRRPMRPNEIAALSAYRSAHLYPNAHKAVLSTAYDLHGYGHVPSRGQVRRASRVLDRQWRKHNPLSPPGEAALMAWMGSVLGAIAGGVVGGALSMATGGATFWATRWIAYAGNIVGTRAVLGSNLVAQPTGKKAKTGATWGSVIFPPLGIGPAIGAHIGAEDNPSSARVLNPCAMASAKRSMNPDKAIGGIIPVVMIDAKGKERTAKVSAEWVTDSIVIHPSMRTLKEVQAAGRGKPATWAVTHLPSGQLVATVGSRKWARELATEIETMAGPGLGSPDPEVAAKAILSGSDAPLVYIGHIQRQSMETKPGKFPKYDDWLFTSTELDDHIALPNPSNVKKEAAMAAAVGGIVGIFAGAAVGMVALGTIGGLLGGAFVNFGIEPVMVGALVGGVWGIPIGASIGTIWGSVRRTGKETGDSSAKMGAGLGSLAGHFILMPPVGAALGAYLGA